MNTKPEDLVDGRFRLVRRLAAGGMGEVWHAQGQSGQPFALKLILPQLRKVDSIVNRFNAEYTTSIRLRSRHAVRCHYNGRDDIHGHYFVMELLEGESLRDLLERERRVPSAKAVEYILEACDVLKEAHGLHVVHRDLKPENLFLARRGAEHIIKVLDFGVARLSHDIHHATEIGAFVGTRNYSAPEQFTDARRVTASADIWSLGAILYELLGGQKAFPAERAIDEAPPPLGALGLAPGLTAVVERCMELDPARRFQQVAELEHALRPFAPTRLEVDGPEAEAPTEIAPPRVAQPVEAQRVIAIEAPSTESMPLRPSRDPRHFAQLPAMLDAMLTATRRDGSLRRVIFMLGAGFSAPRIADANGFVELIRQRLPRNDRVELAQHRDNAGSNLYQAAFRLLRDRTSHHVANTVVREGILQARTDRISLEATEQGQANQCVYLEDDYGKWGLPEGVGHLGQIIEAGLSRSVEGRSIKGSVDARFSGVHLTTNFDPLLAVAVRRAGGVAVPHPVTKDGPIPSLSKETCTILHLHGRWNEGDTLHVELDIERPMLEESLIKLFDGSMVVVVGYGGWNDVFIRALKKMRDRQADYQVLWGFYDNDEASIETKYGELIRELTQHLAPAISFYRAIDSNVLFRELYAKLVPRTHAPVRESRLPSPPPISTEVELPIDGVNPWYFGAAALLATLLTMLLMTRSTGAPSEPTPTTTSSNVEPGLSVPAKSAAPAPAPVKLSLKLTKPCRAKAISLRANGQKGWGVSAELIQGGATIESPVPVQGPLAAAPRFEAKLTFTAGSCVASTSWKDESLVATPCSPSFSCSYSGPPVKQAITVGNNQACKALATQKTKASGKRTAFLADRSKVECFCLWGEAS